MTAEPPLVDLTALPEPLARRENTQIYLDYDIVGSWYGRPPGCAPTTLGRCLAIRVRENIFAGARRLHIPPHIVNPPDGAGVLFTGSVRCTVERGRSAREQSRLGLNAEPG